MVWLWVAFEIFKILLIEYLELALFSDDRTYRIIVLIASRSWSASHYTSFVSLLVMTPKRSPVANQYWHRNPVFVACVVHRLCPESLRVYTALGQLSEIRGLILKVFENRKRTFNIREQQRISIVKFSSFCGQCLNTFVADNSSALSQYSRILPATFNTLSHVASTFAGQRKRSESLPCRKHVWVLSQPRVPSESTASSSSVRLSQ